MAAIVFVTVGPLDFLMGFAVSEAIGFASTTVMKGVMRMTRKVVKCASGRTVKAGKDLFPVSRDTLLTSL
ncbi:hypothetical protein SAMN04488581_4791 [Mycolicibacterium neoaurum]|nr:hypothetical protein SAMN04488581_4791 [Mycolicibacterium neoaurum]